MAYTMPLVLNESVSAG